jgi:hypothetical protein
MKDLDQNLHFRFVVSASIRNVARTSSFGRMDSARAGLPPSNPPSRSSSFGRGDKLPPSSSRQLPSAVATLPRDAERRSRSSGEYVTVLEIGSGGGSGSVVATEVRSRTVPRTRPSGNNNSSKPVSRSNSQEKAAKRKD